LTADRTIGGPFENYVTPEQTIPKRALHVPWESCITMGTSFSFRYEDDYKSTRELVNILVEVVSKGGNLALNVAPQPDGRLPRRAIERMKELGEWLKVYGEAIYGTRICDPYFTDDFAFTCKGDTTYCFRLFKNEADFSFEESLTIPYTQKVNQVEMLGGKGFVEFEQTDAGLTVKVPRLGEGEKAPIAYVFKLT
jgi:alpha-L-fucosidase